MRTVSAPHLLCAVALCVPPMLADAQNYPSRPIRVVVPTTAGGASDIMMRMIAQKMSERFGQSVIVDNRPGAGNVIGTDIVAKSSPDGYTLLLTYTDHVFNPSLHTKLPYDTVKDFAPITMLGSVPMVLVVNPSVPAASVKELIALARTKPGTLNFASAGSGTSLHMAGELFKSLAAIDVVHVPYKGTAPGFVDLVAGQVQFMFPTALSSRQHVQTGKLRALAITSAKRSPAYPDLVTIAEAALPGYDAAIWYCMLAPAAAPKTVIATLNSEVHRVLRLPDVGERLTAQGVDVSASSPGELAALIDRELLKWAKVIKASGVKLQ